MSCIYDIAFWLLLFVIVSLDFLFFLWAAYKIEIKEKSGVLQGMIESLME